MWSEQVNGKKGAKNPMSSSLLTSWPVCHRMNEEGKLFKGRRIIIFVNLSSLFVNKLVLNLSH